MSGFTKLMLCALLVGGAAGAGWALAQPGPGAPAPRANSGFGPCSEDARRL